MSVTSERLKKVRIDTGLSQQAMADELKIPLRTYQSYERGERDLSTAIVRAICMTFDISSDYLIGRDSAPLTEQQAHLAELVEAGDPSDTTRLLLGLPKNEKKPLAAEVPSRSEAYKMIDALPEEDYKELRMFIKYLKFRRSQDKE